MRTHLVQSFILLAAFGLLLSNANAAYPTPEEVCTHQRKEAEKICAHPKGAPYCAETRQAAEQACEDEHKKAALARAEGLDSAGRGEDYAVGAQAGANEYQGKLSQPHCEIKTRLLKVSEPDHWDRTLGAFSIADPRQNGYEGAIEQFVRTSIGTNRDILARWVDTNRRFVRQACERSFAQMRGKEGPIVLIGNYDLPPGHFFSTR